MIEYKIIYVWEKYVTSNYDELLAIVKNEGTNVVETIFKYRLGKYEQKYISKFYFARNA